MILAKLIIVITVIAIAFELYDDVFNDDNSPPYV